MEWPCKPISSIFVLIPCGNILLKNYPNIYPPGKNEDKIPGNVSPIDYKVGSYVLSFFIF